MTSETPTKAVVEPRGYTMTTKLKAPVSMLTKHAKQSREYAESIHEMEKKVRRRFARGNAAAQNGFVLTEDEIEARKKSRRCKAS